MRASRARTRAIGTLAVIAVPASLALVMVASGCASHAKSTSSITKGPGVIDVGDAVVPTASEPDRKAIATAVREAEARRRSEGSVGPLLVERRDAPLRAALAALRASPGELAHLEVAAAYVRVGVLDMAYDHFTEAVRFNPRSVAALDGRARLLRDVGLMNMALVDAHRALYIEPGSAIARNTLGTILERLGQCREAAVAYRKAAHLSKGAEWAEQNVARLSLSCPGQ